ncbi:hypothetical protein DJ031_00905 [bacterium endosymbiont of Escarpia laminata]|nr:MAG: hypothetical protein DJ031_00905 [bacterium endosymbiont of Escarpia laminata]
MKRQTFGYSGAGSFDLFSLLSRLISSRTTIMPLIWLLLSALLFPAFVSAATITTVAGDGTGDAASHIGPITNGAQATETTAAFVSGLAFDAAGDLYYNAYPYILKRDASTRQITIVAGNGNFGYSGDGGPATAAELQGLGVTGLGFDHLDNLLIADSFNDRIRLINGSGTIITLWGDPSFNGQVTDMEYDGGGTLFVVDNQRHQIWITPPGGPTTVFAGTDPVPGDLGVGGFSGDGGPATAAKLDRPLGLAIDAAGNAYFSDRSNHVIRRVDRITRIITTFIGTGTVSGFNGDGGLATAALLNNPGGIDFDSAGNLFIADSGNYRVRRVDAVTGIITTVAGNGTFGFSGDYGDALNAMLGADNVALDANDDLYIADAVKHRVRRVAFSDTAPPTGAISINSGADYTNSVNIILGLTCDDGGGSGCGQMRLRQPPWNYSGFQPFAGTVDYMLSSEGVNTVAVQFVDALGNLSAEFSASITLDVTTPGAALITSPANRDIVGTNTPIFSGTAEAYSTVTLSAYSGSWIPIAMVTTDIDGNWTTVVPPQPDGHRNYRAIPTDRAGNRGWDGNRVGVTIDTTAPAPPVITQPANGSSTIDRTPTFSGSAEMNSTVTLYDGLTVLGTVTTVSFGTSWSFTPTTLLGGGIHDISATATDALGNVSVASAVISVTIEGPDTTPPVVTPPADLEAASSDNGAVVGKSREDIVAFLSGATAVDNLDGVLPVSHDLFSNLDLGTTTVTFSATDAAGNTGTATATITVTDQTPPRFINVPSDLTVPGDSRGEYPASSLPFGSASAADNVDGSLTVANGGITVTVPAVLSLGTTTVTYTATDSVGLTATATSTVTVTDQRPPLFTVLPRTIRADATSADGRPLVEVINTALVRALDDIDGEVAVTHDAPEIFPIGTTEVTFSASDSAGNVGTVVWTVIITAPEADTTPPVVTAPTPAHANLASGTAVPAATFSSFLAGAHATDAVDGDVTLAAIDAGGAPLVDAAAFLAGASALDNVDGVLSVTNNAPDPLPLGTTSVTFSATDAARHTGTATAVITIADQGDPVVTPPTDAILSAVDANGTPTANASAFLTGATAADNVDGTLEVTHDAPDTLPLGDTTVTFSATDAAGNTGTATATVTMTDQSAPVIRAPNGLILFGDAVLGGVNRTQAQVENFLNGATAQDNVDAAPVLSNDAPFLLPFGTTTVTFTTTDAAGNESSRTATVTVNNPEASGDDAPAASGTGLTVGQSNAVGLDPNATATDTDGDGMDDNQEVGDPSEPTDQDGDGVPDVFERGDDASDASKVSGLATETGTVEIQSTGQNLSEVTSSATGAGAPTGVAFPFGVISYETTVSTAGDSQTVRLTFSDLLPEDLVLYKVDAAGNYTAIPTSKWVRVDDYSIDLTLTDGGPFDLDGDANGKIVDPLALGGGAGAATSSGGGGSTSPWLFLLLFSALIVRRTGYAKLRK